MGSTIKSGLSGGQQPKVTDYYAAMHVGLCHGPIDSVNGIMIADKYVYPLADPYSVAATFPMVQPDGEVWNIALDWPSLPKMTLNHTDFLVSMPDLFGGDTGEGGLQGWIGVFLGAHDQVIPDFYAFRMGQSSATCPGYRGIASAFFVHAWALWPGFLWSTNAPVLRETKWTVTRISKPGAMDLTGATIAPIPVPRERSITVDDGHGTSITETVHDLYVAGPDANGAHIIFECLTDDDFGLGVDSSLIDIGSFNTAAAIIFAENLGLSFKWSTQSSVLDFINEVEAHIDGKVFINPNTGLLTLRLVRAVTDLSGAISLDETNSTINSFQRKGWADTVNEFIITWTDPYTEQPETITVQNLANIAIQGYVVADNKSYQGARNPQVAQTIGMRDLRAASAPLSTIEMTANRIAWGTVPTDVVLVSSTEYGLEGKAYRVLKVDYGKTADAKIRLTLVEDVFSLDVGAIQNSFQSRSNPSSLAPVAASVEQAITAPAYMLLKNGKFSSLVDGDAYMAFIGWSPIAEFVAGYLNEQITDSLGNVNWNVTAAIPLLGRTQASLDIEATSYIASVGSYAGGFAGDPTKTYAPPYVGWFGFIGDVADDTREIVMVRQIDLGGTGLPSAYWLTRGCFDTVPRAWPAGTSIYWLDPEVDISSPVLEAAGATVSYRYQTRTMMGSLPIASAPTFTGLVSERPRMPNRPANVKLNGLGLVEKWHLVAVSGVLTPQLPGAPIPALPVVSGMPTITLATGDTLTVEWARRNRLTEDNIVVGWNDSDITPETGATVRIRLEKFSGAVIHEEAGNAGTSTTIAATVVDTISNAVLKLFADNGALTSLQFAEFHVIGPVPPDTMDSTSTTADSTTVTMDTDI